MKWTKLADAFKPLTSQKVFFDLFVSPPWGDITPSLLNLDYFQNHSGAKICSPLVETLLTNGELGDAEKQILVNIATAKYYPKWSRLWETITTEYNFIHNYDMNETILRSENKSGNENDTKAVNTTTIVDRNISRDTTETDFAFGFNSEISDENPSGKYVTDNDDAEDITTTDAVQDVSNSSHTENDAETTTINRAGNIGVTTTQKMIEEERELWVWNFFNQVFEDVDEILSLSVYDICRV